MPPSCATSRWHRRRMNDTEFQALKQYMRIDDMDDDAVIRALGLAAQDYLDAAGIQMTERNQSRYHLAWWALTLHWYERREATGPNEAEIQLGLRQIINQLKCDIGDAE